jgi:hypothetical protein
LPADAPFQKVALNAGERAGVLSHPYVLSNFAYRATSSPIHRGVFVARGLLGRLLRPPPDAVAPLAPELHPDLTTRQRVELQTGDRACQRCHATINALGFALERFDAVGRYRSEENGRPIDASGEYRVPGGAPRRFTGARELAQFLAQSDQTHAAVVEQLFHYLVKQPIRAFGARTTADLRKKFVEGEFNLRSLAVEIAVTAAVQSRAPRPPEPDPDPGPGP